MIWGICFLILVWLSLMFYGVRLVECYVGLVLVCIFSVIVMIVLDGGVDVENMCYGEKGY